MCVWWLRKVSYDYLVAGPERIELPPSGSKPEMISISPKAGKKKNPGAVQNIKRGLAPLPGAVLFGAPGW
jgi:hypothetical protein